MRAVSYLLSWCACDYPENGPAVLTGFPSVTCWDAGKQSVYAVIALLALFAYIASNAFVGVLFLVCGVRSYLMSPP